MNQQEFNKLTYRMLATKCHKKFSSTTWYKWLNEVERSPNLHDIEVLAIDFNVSSTEMFELIRKRRKQQIAKYAA